MASTVPERADASRQRHALQLMEACHDEMVFDPYVTLYQKSGEFNPAHLVGPQPFLYYERKAMERHARREDRPGLVEGGGVVRATSRIATISMKEMRRCFQEIRNLSEADVNPDHVLANGMTMGSFCIEYLNGPAKPKPSRSKRAAVPAPPAREAGVLPPLVESGERDHERIRGLMQNQRRVKQRLMTSYVAKSKSSEIPVDLD